MVRSRSNHDPGVKIIDNTSGEFDLRDSSSEPVVLEVSHGKVQVQSSASTQIVVTEAKRLARKIVEDRMNPPAEDSALRKLLNWFRRADL